MVKNLLYVMCIFLIMSCTVSANTNDIKYNRYLNARFGFGISYPVGILVPQGEADNGDGQRFKSKDGEATMLAYGYNNALDYTLKSVFQSEIKSSKKNAPDRTITYKVLKKNWFVVSGIEKNMIFYKKVICSADEDQFITLSITYPKSQSRFYNPIVSVISKSLKDLPVSSRK